MGEMFRSIGRLLAGILGLTARIGGPIVAVTLLFFVLAMVLVLSGFDLGEVDAWLERTELIEGIVDIGMRILCGLILLLCLLMIWAFFFDRKSADRPGFGCLILALIVGYFAWFGMTMPAP